MSTEGYWYVFLIEFIFSVFIKGLAMQMYVAHSYEIDDPKLAVEDILKALPADILQKSKKNHAVGILSTHADAVSSGVVNALCEAMPFDVVGMTCLAACGDGEVGIDVLTFVLLMDDEVRFATALSEPLFDHGMDDEFYKEAIAKAYGNIQNELALNSEKPALTYLCAPFSHKLNGQIITDCVSEVIGHSPLFGGLASDHTAKASETYVIHNGQCAKRRVALLCMTEPLQAEFMFASLEPNNIRYKESIITSANGTIVHTVNNMPVAEYLASFGLSVSAWEASSALVPFLVDYKDGGPVLAREFLEFTPEGYALFGGEMPEGASINLGLQTPEGVLDGAQKVLDHIESSKENISGVLVVGCAGRSVILGASPLGEGEKALEIINNTLPYQQIYARGEICPAQLVGGELQNRFHNFSFTVCMFKQS